MIYHSLIVSYKILNFILIISALLSLNMDI